MGKDRQLPLSVALFSVPRLDTIAFGFQSLFTHRSAFNVYPFVSRLREQAGHAST